MANQSEIVPAPYVMERTIIMGYVIATSIAFAVYQIADASNQIVNTLWQEGSSSLFDNDKGGLLNFDSDVVSIVIAFGIVLVFMLWMAAAIPFGVVRYLCGARRFSSPAGAIAWGSVIGMLTIPFGFRLLWIAAIEAPYNSFGLDLMWTVEHRSWLFALSGATAGFAYWAIEFSRGPTMVVDLIIRMCRFVGRGQ